MRMAAGRFVLASAAWSIRMAAMRLTSDETLTSARFACDAWTCYATRPTNTSDPKALVAKRGAGSYTPATSHEFTLESTCSVR